MKNGFFLCLVTANEMWTLTILTNARGKASEGRLQLGIITTYWSEITATYRKYSQGAVPVTGCRIRVWENNVPSKLFYSKNAMVSVSERNSHCNCVREVLVPGKKEHNEKKNCSQIQHSSLTRTQNH